MLSQTGAKINMINLASVKGKAAYMKDEPVVLVSNVKIEFTQE